MAADVALPDTVIKASFGNARIDDFLPSESLCHNLVAQRGQCLDVPDGHDVIAGQFGDSASLVGQRIEHYEVFEVHVYENSL